MNEFEPAQSRVEAALQNMLGAANELEPAQSRIEKILYNMLGYNYELEPTQSRIEALLKQILEQGGSGGGGVDPGDIVLRTLNVSQNGTTNAPSGTAYNKVVANVPNAYAASDEGKVVDNGALVSQTTETISQNGTVDTTTVSEVTVNVPNSYGVSDEGKVVSNGALVAQTAHAEVTQNGNIDTTTNNSVTVNVPQGSTPTGTKTINVSQNGTTTEDVAAYANAQIVVAVPIPTYPAAENNSFGGGGS